MIAYTKINAWKDQGITLVPHIRERMVLTSGSRKEL